MNDTEPRWVGIAHPTQVIERYWKPLPTGNTRQDFLHHLVNREASRLLSRWKLLKSRHEMKADRPAVQLCSP
jgi:hypothetical protein